RSVDAGHSSGKWVGSTAKVVGGGGGGKPDMATAGGRDPSRLGEALEHAAAEMRTALGS
ncbi:MAG: DHHA1 domain-containing protein, partial [Planctomycetota bacterium]